MTYSCTFLKTIHVHNIYAIQLGRWWKILNEKLVDQKCNCNYNAQSLLEVGSSMYNRIWGKSMIVSDLKCKLIGRSCIRNYSTISTHKIKSTSTILKSLLSLEGRSLDKTGRGAALDTQELMLSWNALLISVEIVITATKCITYAEAEDEAKKPVTITFPKSRAWTK